MGYDGGDGGGSYVGDYGGRDSGGGGYGAGGYRGYTGGGGNYAPAGGDLTQSSDTSGIDTSGAQPADVTDTGGLAGGADVTDTGGLAGGADITQSGASGDAGGLGTDTSGLGGADVGGGAGGLGTDTSGLGGAGTPGVDATGADTSGFGAGGTGIGALGDQFGGFGTGLGLADVGTDPGVYGLGAAGLGLNLGPSELGGVGSVGGAPDAVSGAGVGASSLAPAGAGAVAGSAPVGAAANVGDVLDVSQGDILGQQDPALAGSPFATSDEEISNQYMAQTGQGASDIAAAADAAAPTNAPTDAADPFAGTQFAQANLGTVSDVAPDQVGSPFATSDEEISNQYMAQTGQGAADITAAADAAAPTNAPADAADRVAGTQYAEADLGTMSDVAPVQVAQMPDTPLQRRIDDLRSRGYSVDKKGNITGLPLVPGQQYPTYPAEGRPIGPGYVYPGQQEPTSGVPLPRADPRTQAGGETDPNLPPDISVPRPLFDENGNPLPNGNFPGLTNVTTPVPAGPDLFSPTPLAEQGGVQPGGYNVPGLTASDSTMTSQRPLSETNAILSGGRALGEFGTVGPQYNYPTGGVPSAFPADPSGFTDVLPYDWSTFDPSLPQAGASVPLPRPDPFLKDPTQYGPGGAYGPAYDPSNLPFLTRIDSPQTRIDSPQPDSPVPLPRERPAGIDSPVPLPRDRPASIDSPVPLPRERPAGIDPVVPLPRERPAGIDPTPPESTPTAFVYPSGGLPAIPPQSGADQQFAYPSGGLPGIPPQSAQASAFVYPSGGLPGIPPDTSGVPLPQARPPGFVYPSGGLPAIPSSATYDPFQPDSPIPPNTLPLPRTAGPSGPAPTYPDSSRPTPGFGGDTTQPPPGFPEALPPRLQGPRDTTVAGGGPAGAPTQAPLAGTLDDIPPRGGIERGPPPPRPPDTLGGMLMAAAAPGAAPAAAVAPGTTAGTTTPLTATQQQQVQQIAAIQQNLTNQWYQTLLNQGLNPNDPAVQAQVQAQVFQQMQQLGINVQAFQQLQQAA